MGGSEKRASSGSGCFSGVLRVLLCKGSLEEKNQPDEFTEPKTTTSGQLNKVADLKPPAAAPGVVARLMGLDSFPADTKWVGPGGRVTPLQDAVRRSRSVNFMDYLLLELDYSQQQQREEAGVVARHRRVRTSVSFREVPGLLTQGNQNHLVLYLNDSKVKAINKRIPELGSKQKVKPRKDNSVCREVGAKKEKNQQYREAARVSKLKDEPNKKVAVKESPSVAARYVHKKPGRNSRARGPMLKLVNEKEVLVESKFMKQMKKKKTKKNKQQNSGEIESVFGPEGSSPVSVLDVKETSSRRRQLTFSDDVRLKDPRSKKKCPSRIDKAGGHEAVKRKGYRGLVENHSEEHHIELIRKLQELTEAEIDESSWVEKASSGIEGLEEICSEFGSDLFDRLLFQLVQELAMSAIGS